MPVTASPSSIHRPNRGRVLLRVGGVAMATGVALLLASCQPRPKHLKACTMDYRPVCAFKDGKRRTFGNLCTAEAEGASGVRPGACGR